MHNTFSTKELQNLYTSAETGRLDLEMLAYFGHQAPSVHNTQPWLLVINNAAQTIEIRPSHARPLAHTDPALRQTWLSLGALTQNMLSVTACLPVRVTQAAQNDSIVLSFKKSAKKQTSRKTLERTVQTILSRHNHRPNFLPQKLSKTVIAKLHISQPSSSGASAKMVFVTDPEHIAALASLSYSATKLALSGKHMRHELAAHINSPFTKKSTGINAAAITPAPHGAILEKHLTKSGRFAERNARKELQRIQTSPLLVLVFTKGDMERDWVAAGQAYEMLCLRATELGLAHSTSAVLAEAPDYYKEVSQLLGQPFRLQTTVRIGYSGPTKRNSSRLPLSEVLEILDDTA